MNNTTNEISTENSTDELILETPTDIKEFNKSLRQHIIHILSASQDTNFKTKIKSKLKRLETKENDKFAHIEVFELVTTEVTINLTKMVIYMHEVTGSVKKELGKILHKTKLIETVPA